MKDEVRKSFYTPISHPFEIARVEPVDCNLCGSKEFRLLGTELSFEIRACRSCGLVYVSPQPVREELGRFYENMYIDGPESAEAASAGYVERHLRRIVARRKPGGGRLLEVGCGYGAMLERMSDLPWDLRALELSEKAAAHAAKRVPRARIVNGGVEDNDFPPGSFDCVLMVAVLEHVKDPRAVLARITQWLAPGGLVVLQVPYVQHFIRVKRWLPRLPVYFEAPRHLFDFGPGCLSRYLEELGYSDIRAEVARPYSSPTRLGMAAIWGVKIPGLVLHGLTGGRYIYPFASAITVHAYKGGG